MWVSGSKMIMATAYRVTSDPEVYLIVDRSGKPISLLETKLKLFIYKQPFTLTDGTPSAFWRFLLPVRLEPLPQPKPR